jgi:hypothetical protein
LKLCFKIFADQKPTWFDAFKAFFAFPADLTFLSFSFGAAAAAQSTAVEMPLSQIGWVVGIALIGVAAAFITNRISKAVERAMDREKFISAIGESSIGYLIASSILYFSVSIKAII